MTAPEGWAVGLRIPASSPFLNIAGSHYREPALYATAEEAEAAPRPEWVKDGEGPNRYVAATAYVRREFHGGVASGRAFRILRTKEESR